MTMKKKEIELDKLAQELKEKGFVVYKKSAPGARIFYAHPNDSRIGCIRNQDKYIYANHTVWEFSRIYKPNAKAGSSCLMSVDNEISYDLAVKNINDRLWVTYVEDYRKRRPEEYNNIKEFIKYYTNFYKDVEVREV